MVAKNITLKQLASLNQDYILYIEHDMDSVTVQAVLKSQMEKVLKKYNVEHIEDLYGDNNVNNKADWSDIQDILSIGAQNVECIDVFIY